METKLECTLIIDDDSVSNYLTARIIRNSHISNQTESVLNVQDALNFIREYASKNDCAPELIIVDINMPGSSGFEFLELLREMPIKNVDQVVVIGLSADKVRKEKAINHFFDDTLLKPFKLADCQSICERHFNHVNI